MTRQEASERYHIPLSILREYESWGLCGAAEPSYGVGQYGEDDLERLSAIMTLHDIGFTTEEAETYGTICTSTRRPRSSRPLPNEPDWREIR